MSDEEPVIAPDQLREGHPKLWRGLAVFSAIALLLLTIGNHHGHVEDIFLIASAVGLVGLLAFDTVQRRYGIKR